jgi:hypothetical protein
MDNDDKMAVLMPMHFLFKKSCSAAHLESLNKILNRTKDNYKFYGGIPLIYKILDNTAVIGTIKDFDLETMKGKIKIDKNTDGGKYIADKINKLESVAFDILIMGRRIEDASKDNKVFIDRIVAFVVREGTSYSSLNTHIQHTNNAIIIETIERIENEIRSTVRSQKISFYKNDNASLEEIQLQIIAALKHCEDKWNEEHADAKIHLKAIIDEETDEFLSYELQVSGPGADKFRHEVFGED